MRMRAQHEPIEILLVEDNPGDVGLVSKICCMPISFKPAAS